MPRNGNTLRGDSTAYLYVMGGDRPPYKLGVSQTPEKRALELRRLFRREFPKHGDFRLHYKALTPYAMHVERLAHRKLGKLDRSAGEHFNVPLKAMIQAIDAAIREYQAMPGEEFARLLDQLGWSGAFVARKFECSRELVRVWQTKAPNPVPPKVAHYIKRAAAWHAQNPPPTDWREEEATA